MSDVVSESKAIRLKGRSFLALVLTPELPFDEWLARLDDLAARSAGFFLRRPIVLDVQNLDVDRTQLRTMIEQLTERNVRIMGLENARASMLAADLPPALTDGRAASDFEPPAERAPGEAPQTNPSPAAYEREPVQGQFTAMPSLTVTEPVRSGQSLVFPDGDVTVVGSVASGAEIIAGGSIHVYGALRGRALAGTMGNSSARIFCRKLEAELIAIDGFYKTAEDMEHELRGQAVQIWLEGEAIVAETLS
ncbi:septum site-determining protein MinC [Tianweitania sp. BSSL-BM11]|uniref:Probable septum site-determining protein MinC n=1 Tax=Tianweitania aestuarii TaxID=2814886 RepID=A0ABS5RYL9_9HYPH|nr:septum site-determining protein MinC [Tianweitania aestuarii]MBS9722145.1 septum site-determining protein MinC [Tianweitania aestuarii]